MTTELKRGTRREDGYVLAFFRPGYGPVWYSPSSWHRSHIANSRLKAKKRAEDRDLPFDLDIEYLLSIYPEDSKCPALGIEMVWGRPCVSPDTPTLDRIVPDRGYVKGNVAFISHRANRIKSDASKEDLERILSYLN